MRYYDGRFLLLDTETGFRADQLTAESLESLGGVEVVKLKIHEKSELLLPYILNKPVVNPNQLNLADWTEKVNVSAAKSETMLRKALTTKNIEETEENIQALLEIPVNVKKQASLPLPKNFLKFAAGDPMATRAVKRRVSEDGVQYKHPNKTVPQLDAVDPIYIRLPDPDVVITHEIGESYPSSQIDLQFKPYPNILYRMKYIKNVLKAPTVEERTTQLKKMISLAKTQYLTEIPDTEANKLVKNFELLPYEYVFGKKENDALPIMDNELPFYENLVEFIRYHIQAFNKEVMVNSSEEEIAQKTESDFASGNLPLRLQDYLIDLLFYICTKNFGHTGNTNITLDEDEDEEGEGNSDSFQVSIAKRDRRQSDLNIVVSSYLSSSAERYGAQVWAEGIVKMLRWGERRIEALYVGTNNTQSLDLYDMDIITSATVDLTNFEAEVDEQGRSLIALGSSFVEFKTEDSISRKTYPFVIAAYTLGKLPGMDQYIKPITVMTLFDIVRSYTTGKPVLRDISFDGTEFWYEYEGEPDPLLQTDMSEIKEEKAYLLEEFVEFAIENGVTKFGGSAKAVMDQDVLEEYNDGAPLLRRLAKTPKPMRNAVVQGAFLNVFSKAAEDLNERNPVSLLNWYLVNIYPHHLQAYSDTFQVEVEEVAVATAESTAGLNATNLGTASFFGVADTDTVEVKREVQEEENEFMYNVYDGDKLQFGKLVHEVQGNKLIIGGYARVEKNGKQVMVFADSTEVESYSATLDEANVKSMIARFWEISVSADKNNNRTPVSMVMSQNTIGKIFRAIFGE